MDRYLIREPRNNGDFPQGNQMIAFSPNIGNNNNMIPPEAGYYGGYAAEFPMHRVGSSGYMGVHVTTPFAPPNVTNLLPNQAQVISGIDPRYLASYADNNATYIAGQQRQMPYEHTHILNQNPKMGNQTFSGDYQNRIFAGADRNTKSLAPQMGSNVQPAMSHRRQEEFFKINMQDNTKVVMPPKQQEPQNKACNGGPYKDTSVAFHAPQGNNRWVGPVCYDDKKATAMTNAGANNTIPQLPPKESAGDVDLVKKELQTLTKTRFDNLKALYKSGPRAFSGPVEKVLKWHKALQDIGVLVLFEIVAKCVSVRTGESCSKNLVVRDDNGPAMQVVYYEIDFLLSQLKTPCTVRVIGRMMPGTCRLQAFHVRPATGDDVATLPRRAAVAAHHVAKLCKEYSTNNV